MTAQLDNVVSREAAWFTAEPPATFSTAPALISTSGGSFDVVQGYFRKTPPRGRDLFISCEKSEEERIALGGIKQWLHSLRIDIVWSLGATTGKLEDDLQALDTAIAAVVTRIRGPQGDKTHGSAFTWVGEGDGGEGIIEIDKGDQFQQAMSKQGRLEVVIRYQAADTFAG